MRAPENFDELTFEQFNRWRVFWLLNKEAPRARQVQALLGLSDRDALRAAVSLSPDYFDRLVASAADVPKSAGSVRVNRKRVALPEEFDLFGLTFGAAQALQQAHEDALQHIAEAPKYRALIEDFEGRDAFTEAEKARIAEVSDEGLAAYYEALPDLLAWVVVGLKAQPVTDEAHAEARKAVIAAKASQIRAFSDNLKSDDSPEGVLPLGIAEVNLAKAVEQLKRVETHLFVNPANLNSNALIEFRKREAQVKAYTKEAPTTNARVLAFAKSRGATAFSEVEALPFSEYYIQGTIEAREREISLNIQADAKQKHK